MAALQSSEITCGWVASPSDRSYSGLTISPLTFPHGFSLTTSKGVKKDYGKGQARII
jgi:hypothetical protein